jgi:transcriptional regulator of acetoin/glycerol metabolism
VGTYGSAGSKKTLADRINAQKKISIIKEEPMKSQTKTRRRMERPETYLVKLRKKLKVRPLVETKRREVARALTVARGDKVLAAALLGIGKTTIYRTLENGLY